MSYPQGDTKGPARGADGSTKKDMTGAQLSSDAQVSFGTIISSRAITQKLIFSYFSPCG